MCTSGRKRENLDMECLKYADFKFWRIQALFPWDLVVKRELKMAANVFGWIKFCILIFNTSSLLTVKQGCFEEMQIVMHQYFEISLLFIWQITFCFYGKFRLKPVLSQSTPSKPHDVGVYLTVCFQGYSFTWDHIIFATLTLPRAGFICFYVCTLAKLCRTLNEINSPPKHSAVHTSHWFTHLCVRACLCMYVCIYIYVCVCVCVCVCVYYVEREKERERESWKVSER